LYNSQNKNYPLLKFNSVNKSHLHGYMNMPELKFGGLYISLNSFNNYEM